MKRVFLDTNVILDLKREPFYSDTIQLFTASGHFNYFTSSLSIANSFYLVERVFSTLQAKHDMEKICSHLRIIQVSESIVHQALQSLFKEFRDFEDAIQYYCAIAERMECMVTRNEKDFRNAALPVYSPRKFSKHFIA
jgi:predicted nucleic acid-binding protein